MSILVSKKTKPIDVRVILSPAHSVLAAMAVICKPAFYTAAEPWLRSTTKKMTVSQFENVRTVFRTIDKKLYPSREFDLFADYLSEIEKIDHKSFTLLKELWRGFFMPEWDRQPYLKSMADNLNGREWPMKVKSAENVVQSFLRRPVPPFIGRKLGEVDEIIFCPSPFLELQAAHFGSEKTMWIFISSDPRKLPMRYEPIQRSEVARLTSALADESRLQILEMLTAYGPMRSQEIIEQLGVSQPTVSRQLKQLKATQFLFETRDGDASKIFDLNHLRLGEISHLLDTLLSKENARMVLNDPRLDQPAELRKFLNEDGQIYKYPNKLQAQEMIIGYLVEKLEKGKKYTEKEMNELLNKWHTYKDPARLRRDLVDFGYVKRTADGSEYWLE